MTNLFTYFIATKVAQELRESSRLGIALIVLLSIGIGNAQADATFTSSSEAATSAKNGISLSVTGGELGQGDYYRINKGATLTVSSSSGNITSIVFTCTTSDYAKLASHNPAGTYSESGATVTWTGSATTVTFTAKTGSNNNNFRFTEIAITGGASCSANPTVGDASLNGSFSMTSTTSGISVASGTCGAGDNCSWADYGFVWSDGDDSTTPTVSNNKVQKGTSGTSTSWTATITPSNSTDPTSWATGHTYYVRTYGKNNKASATYYYGDAWSFTPLSVSFNGNTSTSGSMSTQYIRSGVSTALTSNAFSKTGHDFAGWATASDGDVVYSNGASVNVTENLSLYAKWDIKSYTLTWNLNGGTVSVAGTGAAKDATGSPSSSVVYNTSITAPTVIKTGYNFSSWNTTPATNMPAANTTYTAQWSVINYTITYNNMDGATNHASNPSTYTIESNAITLQTPTKTGYTFGGWFTDADLAVGHAVSTPAIAKGSTGDKTFYAKWTAKETTVSFDQNTGSGGQTDDVTATYDAAMPTPITVPTRTGYTFQGYYDGSGGTGTKYYNADGTSAKTWDKEDETYTLYAKWTAINCTVTWKVNGTAWTPHDPDSDPDDGKVNGSTNADYDTPWSSLTLPSDPTTSDGCGDKFMGWIAETLEGEVDDEDDIEGIEEKILNSSTQSTRSTKIEGNTVFHAVFADYAE